MIDRFESSIYMGPRQEFMFRTLVVAWGEIHGQTYTYAEFYEESECPPGTVKADFVQMAKVAFERAAEQAAQ